jgi:hypothetical protein
MHMSLNNITSAKLKQLIWIVEKRERVREELRDIESTLSSFLSPEPANSPPQMPRRTRKPGSARASKRPLEMKTAKSKAQQAESKSGQRHGALKDSILAALRKADGAGIPIKELSRTLGVKTQNLHVWFSSTGRTVKGVTKVSAGRWAYKGN